MRIDLHPEQRDLMASIKVELTRIIDFGFPNVGAFEFRDLLGEVVVVHEKLPVAGLEEPGRVDALPINVVLECKVISRSHADTVIDISEPYGMEDVQGRTQFRVNPELVEG